MTLSFRRGVAGAVLASGLIFGLAACDGGPSAVASRDPTPDVAKIAVDHRQDPVPLLAGQPIWAASRKHTAQENVEYHFKRDGADFGVDTAEAYALKARGFLKSPPKGALTLVRSNGDRLVYDPATNVFGVMTDEGAPRTLFKPRQGIEYWRAQEAREAKRTERAQSRSGAEDRG